MFGIALVCSGLLLSATPDEAGRAAQTAADLQAYETARTETGRDADAHVRLALWCEEHGLDAERAKHLAMAVLIDPGNAVARTLMGLVEDQGKWRKPAEVAERVQDDPELLANLDEYARRRAETPETADAHWELALWCEEHGLEAEATAHLATVIRLDPNREAAWKRLGYKKVGGRWATDAQIAEAKADAEAQRKADRHWKPQLETWKSWLGRRDKHGEAEAALAGVDDPRAVPSVWHVFVTRDADDQLRAVQVLGQIDSAGASKALALVSVFSESADVRRVATETLRRRDPREFADTLIRLVRDPVKYEVRPVGGPGSPGELYVQGEKFDIKRFYSSPAVPMPGPGDRMIGYDEFGLPVVGRDLGITSHFSTNARALLGDGFFSGLRPTQSSSALAAGTARATSLLAQSGIPNSAGLGQALAGSIATNQAAGDPLTAFALMENANNPLNPGSKLSYDLRSTLQIPIGRMQLEAQRAALNAQSRLEADVAAIENYNTPIKALNDRVVPVLRETTGADINADRSAWENWWVDQLGYAARVDSRYKPTIVQQSFIPAQPVPVGITNTPINFQRMSCFGAGTLVHTLTGTRPIEQLLVGDLVLSQDVESVPWVTSPCWSCITTRPARRSGSPSRTGNRSSPASSIGSGVPARAGRWPAT